MKSNSLFNTEYYRIWKKYSNLSASTIENYEYALKNLDSFIYSQKGYTGEINFDKFYYYTESDTYKPLDTKIINEFIAHLKSQNATGWILSNSITGLRSFFTFLKSMKMTQTNPMKYYKNPYCNQIKKDSSLSEKECDQLLLAALQLDPFSRQLYVMVLLMLTTGLRNSELRELTISQIDFGRRIIYVDRGQKTTESTVFMTEELSQQLKHYLQSPLFIKWQQQGNDLVFFRNNRKLTYRHTLNNLLKSICKKAGIRIISAHWLRHTMAYLLQLSGVDTTIIQRQLRHKYLETTLRYLPSISTEVLREV